MKRGPAFLFFIFRFEYLISGPKSYRDFRETGPWKLKPEHGAFVHYFSFLLLLNIPLLTLTSSLCMCSHIFKTPQALTQLWFIEMVSS